MKLPQTIYDVASRVPSTIDIDFEVSNPLIIIGANGAGKSRLGSRIEDSYTVDKVRRVSGQRALRIPLNVPLKNLAQSSHAMMYGHEDTNRASGTKWHQGKTSTLLNDFEALLSLLFATESKRDSDFTKLFRGAASPVGLVVPKSPIDSIVEIWNEIMPHRKISFIENKIKISIPSSDEYEGNEMSDGEKVTLYLLSQCLTASNSCTIIIDEPEIHLHKSIMSKLWTLIENNRKDCQFVYITHDYEFAASRPNSTILWCKEFFKVGNAVNNQIWDWEFVEDNDDIPEDIKLELLGNRKNILFTEGVVGGIDHQVFSAVYNDFKIVPVAGCAKVIESTKAFRNYKQLSHLKVEGVIDVDYRTTAEMTSLSTGHNIHTLDVAEIENVLISEEVFRVVAEKLGYPDVDAKVVELVDRIITKLNGHLIEQTSRRTSDEVLFLMERFDRKKVGLTDVENEISSTMSSIDVPLLYSENEELYNTAIASRDLNQLLKIYNNKGLVGDAAIVVGKRNKKEYSEYVQRLLIHETHKVDITTALMTVLPTLT